MPDILLINDNSKYLKDALPLYGYAVHSVSDGVQVLNLLAKFPKKFDIVLLDIMLPLKNGFEIIKYIRKNTKTAALPIIIITEIKDTETMVAGLKTGADDYIIKPFALPNLLARMEAVLRRSYRLQDNYVKKLNFETIEPKRPLTEREREVLLMAAKGSSNKKIADKLFLKEVTVKKHMNNIFKKLKVTSRTQAILAAMQMDLINS